VELGLKLGLRVDAETAPREARRYAEWGVDLVKLDCGHASATQGLADQSAAIPAIRAVASNVVVIVTQDGLADAAAQDAAVHAQAWRTRSYRSATWQAIEHVGFDGTVNLGSGPPWADLGDLRVGPIVHAVPLRPEEQYAHVSLWCLRASPLWLAGDPTQLDAFTLGLLTNDEVLAVDQDPLGAKARGIRYTGIEDPAGRYVHVFVWARSLVDGVAVGIFNQGLDAHDVAVSWDELAQSGVPVSGPQVVRDLWRQVDLGENADGITVRVPAHGAQLLKLRVPPRR
jgi:alpha-galactosidase